jgi:hypothetical protein
MIPDTLTGAIIADAALRGGWEEIPTNRGVRFSRGGEAVEVIFTSTGGVRNATLSRDGATIGQIAYREPDKGATISRWLKAPKAPVAKVAETEEFVPALGPEYTVTEVRSGDKINPDDALVSVTGDLGVFRKVMRGPESEGPPVVLVSKGPGWSTPSLATDWTLQIKHNATGATGGAGMPDHQHFEGVGSGVRDVVGPNREVTRHTSCGECGQRFSFKTGQTIRQPVHRDGMIDERYSVRIQYNGHSEGPHYVVRFDGAYVGSAPIADGAWAIARAHAARRHEEISAAPGEVTR